jgi:hypothetical protein
MESDKRTRTITLFCWVLDTSDNVFLVDIEDNRTVGHLKKAILKKKRNTFAQVDARQLILWKVCGFVHSCSQLSHKYLKEEVNKYQFLDEDALLVVDLLSDIFPDPKPSEEAVHVIVRVLPVGEYSLAPSIALSCH